MCGEWASTWRHVAELRGQASGWADGIVGSRSCDKVGEKNNHGGRYLSHTYYELINVGTLEDYFVEKIFHL